MLCSAQYRVSDSIKRCKLSPLLLAFLIALRAKNLPLYSSLTKETPDMIEVCSFITGLAGGQKYWGSYYGIELEAFHALSKGPRPSYSIGKEPHKHTLENHGIDSPQGKRAADILEQIDELHRAHASGGLRSTIQRIELTEQFTIS